jgi:hypothetical protein
MAKAKQKDPRAKLHAGMALVAEALREADDEEEDDGLEWRVDVESARHDETIELSQLVSIGVSTDDNGNIICYRLGFANVDPIHVLKNRRDGR